MIRSTHLSWATAGVALGLAAWYHVMLPEPALAEEQPVIAVVPLDGPPGTSSRDLTVVARGLAEALASTGRTSVIHGESLLQGLTAGRQREIQEARDAFEEGRLLLRDGDADIGLSFLSESLAAHDRAGSAVVRREEMADVAFTLAEALVAVDRDTEARAALSQALRLLPDYLDVRTTTANPELRALARDIEAELLTRPPRTLSADGARALAADLQVAWVVHGYVQTDGALVFHLHDRDGLRIHAEEIPAPFQARRVGDPWYGVVASRLTAAAFGEPLPPGPSPPEAPDPPTLPPMDAPKPPERQAPRKGVAIGVGLTAGLLAAGAATAAIVLTQPREPQDAWTLQIVVR